MISAGRMSIEELRKALDRSQPGPTVVWLQAGDLNTGQFDPFEEACETAHESSPWVHVDGAFGLWVATSSKYRHLLAGAEKADFLGDGRAQSGQPAV